MGDQHSANTRFTTPVMSDPIRDSHHSGYHNLRSVFHQQGQHRHADMDLSIAWEMSWNLGRYMIPLPAPGKPPKETCRNLWIWNLGSRPAWLLISVDAARPWWCPKPLWSDCVGCLCFQGTNEGSLVPPAQFRLPVDVWRGLRIAMFVLSMSVTMFCPCP